MNEEKDSEKTLSESPVDSEEAPHHEDEAKSSDDSKFSADVVKTENPAQSPESKETPGRKSKPLGCCGFPLGETVKCKWCIKNYHLKCLEPPLLYVPPNFVCERHLPEDMPPEPVSHKQPEAFSNYLLQSKVKIDWPLTDGDRVSRKCLKAFEEEILHEVDGTRTQCFNIREGLLPSQKSMLSPAPLSSLSSSSSTSLSSSSSSSSSQPTENGSEETKEKKGCGYDLKNIFRPEYLEEATKKDWSENAKLFQQFDDWISMLRTLREAKYLKALISAEKRKAASQPTDGTPPAKIPFLATDVLMKKLPPLDTPRNPVILETQIDLLNSEDDLNSSYTQSTFSENVLSVAKIRKALSSGDLAGLDGFPKLRAAVEAAPKMGEGAAPCLAMNGRVVFVLDKDKTTIGRCKEGENPPDIDLSALFGELCHKIISHLHATIICKNKDLKKFVLYVNGRNGLFVDGLHRFQGDSVLLKNGTQITFGLLTFEYVDL